MPTPSPNFLWKITTPIIFAHNIWRPVGVNEASLSHFCFSVILVLDYSKSLKWVYTDYLQIPKGGSLIYISKICYCLLPYIFDTSPLRHCWIFETPYNFSKKTPLHILNALSNTPYFEKKLLPQFLWPQFEWKYTNTHVKRVYCCLVGIL